MTETFTNYSPECKYSKTKLSLALFMHTKQFYGITRQGFDILVPGEVHPGCQVGSSVLFVAPFATLLATVTLIPAIITKMYATSNHSYREWSTRSRKC